MWVSIIASRVAKCQIVYTDQIFQTKLYPKKGAKIATTSTLRLKKRIRHIATSGGGLVGSHRSPQINQFLNKTLLKFVEFTPKLLHFHKSAWSPKMFTPTFHYFYTDISAISVKYWIFVHISCHSLHHSNVYVLRGITAFSLLCFAHNPGKMAISLMPYQD